MTDTPEDWVLIEGAKRGGFNPDLRSLRSMYAGDGLWKATYRALCDMIAKHEQQPVDRKLLRKAAMDNLIANSTEEMLLFGLTRLYHQGRDGVLREVKRVSSKEFAELRHNFRGIPVVYAVWPEEAEQ